MLVSQDLAPAVVGRGGETVKRIGQSTGTFLTLTRPGELPQYPGDQVLLLVGKDYDSVLSAMCMVQAELLTRNPMEAQWRSLIPTAARDTIVQNMHLWGHQTGTSLTLAEAEAGDADQLLYVSGELQGVQAAYQHVLGAVQLVADAGALPEEYSKLCDRAPGTLPRGAGAGAGRGADAGPPVAQPFSLFSATPGGGGGGAGLPPLRAPTALGTLAAPAGRGGQQAAAAAPAALAPVATLGSTAALTSSSTVKLRLPSNLPTGPFIGRRGSFMRELSQRGLRNIHIEPAAGDGEPQWLSMSGSLDQLYLGLQLAQARGDALMAGEQVP